MNNIQIQSSPDISTVDKDTQVLEDDVPLPLLLLIEKKTKTPGVYNQTTLAHSLCPDICSFVLEDQKLKNLEVTIQLCTEKEIKNFNKQFRNKEVSTDVLSFSYLADESSDKVETQTYKYFGDVCICPSYIVKQAKKFHESYVTELIRITIHGVLHLCGYTHKSYSPNEPMFIKQEELLQKFMSYQKT